MWQLSIAGKEGLKKKSRRKISGYAKTTSTKYHTEIAMKKKRESEINNAHSSRSNWVSELCAQPLNSLAGTKGQLGQ